MEFVEQPYYQDNQLLFHGTQQLVISLNSLLNRFITTIIHNSYKISNRQGDGIGELNGLVKFNVKFYKFKNIYIVYTVNVKVAKNIAFIVLVSISI